MTTKTKKPKRTNAFPRVRCTEQERQLFDQRAKDVGLSPSEFARRAYLESLVVVRESAFDVRAITELSQASQQLIAIGNNLNQLARRANRRKDVDPAQIENTLAAVEAATVEIQTLISRAI